MVRDVTDDAFLGGLVRVEQPAKGYRAGVDAVLLAATVEPGPAPRAVRVLDVGAGVGTVGLCIAARVPSAGVVLMEREPALAALAVRNVAENHFDGRVTVATASIAASVVELELAGLEDQSFDHVVANPPYHDEGRGTPAPNGLKAASHAMPDADLDAWVRFMARMARPSGQVTLIHKAEALGQVLQVMRGRFGAVVVLPIHPRAGAPAGRIIVRGTKGSRGPLTLLPGLFLHGPGNAFLDVPAAILRHGAPLALAAGA